jgi:hypothetical protein
MRSCAVRNDLKTLSGQAKTVATSGNLPLDDQMKMAQDLNSFYCRFERDGVEDEIGNTVSDLGGKVADEDDYEIEGETVESIFRRLNVRKAVGPDGISQSYAHLGTCRTH